MTNSAPENWLADFAIDPQVKPNFFARKEDLTSTVPQAHVLRYAFDRLGLDGVLCSNNTPLARLIQRGQGLSVDFDRAGLSVRRRGGVGI